MMLVCAASIFSMRDLSPFASFLARLYDRCTASELAPGDSPSTCDRIKASVFRISLWVSVASCVPTCCLTSPQRLPTCLQARQKCSTCSESVMTLCKTSLIRMIPTHQVQCQWCIGWNQLLHLVGVWSATVRCSCHSCPHADASPPPAWLKRSHARPQAHRWCCGADEPVGQRAAARGNW